MRPYKFAAILLISALMLVSGHTKLLAVEPSEMLDDPKLEARAREISAELRCLVCQNQSIDDSNASLAKDLRVLVRERLKAGDSNADVLSFVVARYGEFVLLRPPFGINTFLLWGMPVIILLLAGAGIYSMYRPAKGEDAVGAEGMALSETEKQRLKEILGED